MNEFDNLEKKVDKLTTEWQFIQMTQEMANLSTCQSITISEINDDICISKIYKKICKYGTKYEELCTLHKIDNDVMQNTQIYIKLQSIVEKIFNKL